MTRYASSISLAAFLTFGLGTAVSFAGEPAPAEQKDKKDMSGSKADDDQKKKKDEKEKKDMGGK
jgi:ribosomal protein L12E/L44/L45/RPP1/RPP2